MAGEPGQGVQATGVKPPLGTPRSPLATGSAPALGAWRALLAVTFGCAAVAIAGWVPLSLPTRLLALLVPRQATCSDLELGSPAMYVCNSPFPWLILLAPIVFTAVLFLFRRQMGSWLRGTIVPMVPEASRFLAAPMIATGIFAISWSYLHASTWSRVGLLPEIVFPVLIGLFTYGSVTYRAELQRRLDSFINLRDRIPRMLRIGLAIALPTLLAIFIVRLTPNVDLSSQSIVAISLVLVLAMTLPAANPRESQLA